MQNQGKRRPGSGKPLKPGKHGKFGKAVKPIKITSVKVTTTSGEIVVPGDSPSSRFRLKVVLHEAEEGGYWAEVPGFPGCVSEGETLDEVRANIREAFEGVFASMQNEPVENGRVEEIVL